MVAFSSISVSVPSEVIMEKTEHHESDEYSFQDAKKELEYWIEIYEGQMKSWPIEFRFKYKKGREPDVLAYLLLNDEEKRLIQN